MEKNTLAPLLQLDHRIFHDATLKTHSPEAYAGLYHTGKRGYFTTSNMTSIPPPTPDRAAYLTELDARFAETVLPAISVLVVLMLAGAVGNAAVLYVYTCRSRSKGGTVTRFIQALAVFDLLSCCLAIPGEIMDMRNNFTFGGSPVCKFVRTLNLFCTLASGITLIVVAVDRYKRICSPLKRQISPRGAAIIVCITTIIALILSTPTAVIYGKRTVTTDHPLVTGTDCSIADRYVKTSLPLVYNGIQMSLFAVGFFILLILYVLIARRIGRHANQRLQRRRSLHIGASANLTLAQGFPASPSDAISSSSPSTQLASPLTPSPLHRGISESNNGCSEKVNRFFINSPNKENGSSEKGQNKADTNSTSLEEKLKTKDTKSLEDQEFSTESTVFKYDSQSSGTNHNQQSTFANPLKLERNQTFTMWHGHEAADEDSGISIDSSPVVTPYTTDKPQTNYTQTPPSFETSPKTYHNIGHTYRRELQVERQNNTADSTEASSTNILNNERNACTSIFPQSGVLDATKKHSRLKKDGNRVNNQHINSKTKEEQFSNLETNYSLGAQLKQTQKTVPNKINQTNHLQSQGCVSIVGHNIFPNKAKSCCDLSKRNTKDKDIKLKHDLSPPDDIRMLGNDAIHMADFSGDDLGSGDELLTNHKKMSIRSAEVASNAKETYSSFDKLNTASIKNSKKSPQTTSNVKKSASQTKISPGRRSLKARLADSTNNILGKLLSSEQTYSEWDATLEVFDVVDIDKMEDKASTHDRGLRKCSEPVNVLRSPIANDEQCRDDERGSKYYDKHKVQVDYKCDRTGERQKRPDNSMSTRSINIVGHCQRDECRESLAETFSSTTNEQFAMGGSVRIPRKPKYATKIKILTWARHSYGESEVEPAEAPVYTDGIHHYEDTYEVTNEIKDINICGDENDEEDCNGCERSTEDVGVDTTNKKTVLFRNSSLASQDVQVTLRRQTKEIETAKTCKSEATEECDGVNKSTLRQRRRGSSFRAFRDLKLRRLSFRSDTPGTRRTTLILFLISLVYVVSFLPHLTMMTIKSVRPEAISDSGRSEGWTLASNLIIRSYFLNSVANPFIYTFLSKNFMRRIKETFVSHWKRGCWRS